MPSALLLYALIAVAGFGAGWSVNGWRLSGEIALLEGKLATERNQVAVLAEGIKACNASVELARRNGDAAIRVGRELLDQAKRLHAGDRGTAEKLEALLAKPPPAGAGCDQAWQDIEKARAAP